MKHSTAPRPSGRVVEGIKAAASAFKIDYETMLRAKAAGCPNFRQGGRVAEEGLREWIAANAALLEVKGEKGETVSLKDQKTNEEIRKLKILNDLKESKLISRESVIAEHHKFEKAFRELINQKLVAEYPAMVAGLDIPSARVYGRNLCDALTEEMRKLVGAFAI
jgi:hypothetical protein